MKACNHDYEGTYFRNGAKIIVFDQCFICGEYGMRGNFISSFQPFKRQIEDTVKAMTEIIEDSDDGAHQGEISIMRRQCQWLENILRQLD